MDALISSLTGAAWLGVAAFLLWNAVACLRRASSQDANLPFFGMLGRRGVTVAQAEQAVGISEVSRAVRRCVFCRSNTACREHLSDECPNVTVLERASSR
jgi:hypothetical protein